jgi:hypothetical protein
LALIIIIVIVTTTIIAIVIVITATTIAITIVIVTAITIIIATATIPTIIRIIIEILNLKLTAFSDGLNSFSFKHLAFPAVYYSRTQTSSSIKSTNGSLFTNYDKL